MLIDGTPTNKIQQDAGDKSPGGTYLERQGTSQGGRPPMPKNVSISNKHKEVINRYLQLKEENKINAGGQKKGTAADVTGGSLRVSKNSLETETQRTTAAN